MKKVIFKGYYLGLDDRTGSLAIVADNIVVSDSDGRHTRTLRQNDAGRKIHKILGEGKTRRALRITIEEVI